MHISLLAIIGYGILSGLIMRLAFGILLRFFKGGNLDLANYVGCFITGESHTLSSFIAGFAAHVFFSAFFAYVYVYIINYFSIPVSIVNAVLFGIGSTLLSGAAMILLDSMNSCVKSGAIKAIGFCASGYGKQGVIVYLLIHIVYAVSFFVFIKASV